jgi:hypothetical protein
MTDTTGQQPRGEDGRLQCLECGHWYKLLAPHLAPAHAMSTAEYRAAHHLPRHLSLRASDLNESARVQGVARYAARPDIRAHMQSGRQAINLDNAIAGTRDTATYAMVRAAHKRGGQGKQAAARRRMDNRANHLGYADIEAYFAARIGVATAQLARELGIPRTTVTTWRRQSSDASARGAVPD